jgi:deoxyribonuclease-4
MGKQAVKLGANTLQFFTRNPRGGKAKELDEADIEKFLAFAKENQFGRLVAHAPYTLNACSDKPEVLDFAKRAMKEDLERLEYLPDNYYNFHPGSHVGQGSEVGIEKIAGLLNALLTKEQKTTVLLETMAGKGSEIGGTFEELKKIISLTECKEKLGVCLDTCHIFDGGYDIKDNLEGVLEEFDRIIGLDRLKAVHLNDSMYGLGSHKDRHAKWGEGLLGWEAAFAVINHSSLRALPFCLETPNELPGYAEEIRILRENYRE